MAQRLRIPFFVLALGAFSVVAVPHDAEARPTMCRGTAGDCKWLVESGDGYYSLTTSCPSGVSSSLIPYAQAAAICGR